MGKFGIHRIGQVAHPARHRGARVHLVAQEGAEQRVGRYRLGIGIVRVHFGDVARIHATLPIFGKIVCQPQVAHALGHIGGRIALARHHRTAGDLLVELLILGIYPGEVAFGEQPGCDA